MLAKSFRAYLLIREAELVAAGYQYCWTCGEWIKSRYRHPRRVQAVPRPRRADVAGATFRASRLAGRATG